MEDINDEILKLDEEIANMKKLNLCGKKIIHKKFGEGKIVSQENQYIDVKFNDKCVKKFEIYLAYSNNFIEIEDKAICEKLEKITILENKKKELGKKLTLDKIVKKETINNVTSDIQNCMIIVKSADSSADNLKLNLYYDKTRNGCANYGYIGLYNDKSVYAIGKIKKIVKASYKNNNLFCESLFDGMAVTEEEKEKINEAIKSAENIGWNNVRNEDHNYFMVEKFVFTDFRKSSNGGLMGRKKIDLCKITGKEMLPNSIEEIAKVLSDKTWE